MKKFTLCICCFLFLLCLAGAAGVSAEPKAYDLLLPQADSRYYTESDIEDMPAQVICYAKNEIYAMHGRKFLSEELTAYFQSQPWYYGSVEAQDFSADVFNDYEAANVELLSKKEEELGKDAYVLDQPGYTDDEIIRYLSGRADADVTDGIGANAWCDNENQIFSTDCLMFHIPDAWMAGFIYDISEDAISFKCQAVWEAEGPEDGTFCTICRREEYVDPDDFPSADYLGNAGEKYYYLLYPTDLRYDPADTQAAELYAEMLEGVSEMLSSIRLFSA